MRLFEKKKWGRKMQIFLFVVFVFACGIYLFFSRAEFGAVPSGERLARIEQSSNYRGGVFQNSLETQRISGDVSFFAMMREFLFADDSGQKPPAALPAKPLDVAALPVGEDVVVWLGHSSLYLQMGGQKILVDPVFSDHAAPLRFLNRAFPAAVQYSAAGMPEIDLLLITHDHWDHLDMPSIVALKDKTTLFICPLGVGAHLEKWGVAPEKIVETDWDESTAVGGGLTVHTLEARHYSGRSLVRDKTLWAAYLLESGERRVFISGDTGYSPHFAAIGTRFPGIDLAIIESGQYGKNWPLIHLLPEQLFTAAEDLNAKRLLTVHNGRFDIANHLWDTPYETALANREKSTVALLTPMMGESVLLDREQRFKTWWRGVK